jgi:transcriptional regulator with XRE-family HTH domain
MRMVHAMTFGESMRALMAERGISLRKLAKTIPADVGHLSRISRDLKPPSAEMAERIDTALDARGRLAAARSQDVTKRRNALKLGLVAAAVPTVRQRVIEALEMLENDRLSAVIDGLGALVDHYSLTVCSQPPIEVYDELLAVRSYASTALKRGVSPHGVDLNLLIGWLSHLLSVAACDMGEHGSRESGAPMPSAAAMTYDIQISGRGRF